MPAPLITSDLDRQIGITSVSHANQGFGRRNRHRNQNQHRHHGPDDFDQCAFMELGGHHTTRFAVMVDRPEHHSEHPCADSHANPEDQHVQVVDIPADSGDARRHVQSVIGVGASAPHQQCAADGDAARMRDATGGHSFFSCFYLPRPTLG